MRTVFRCQEPGCGFATEDVAAARAHNGRAERDALGAETWVDGAHAGRGIVGTFVEA